MYEVEILEHFSKAPIFTLSDVNQIVSNRVYAKKLVSRMVGSGRVKRVKKGLYTMHGDPFLISTFLLRPSYISSVSALAYHRRITQIPKEVFCFTSKLPMRYFFMEEINFFHTKYFFGFEGMDYLGFTVPVATPEKALIDSIGRVPLDLVEEAFDGLDGGRVVSYLKRIGRSCTAKRIGYLMEKHGHRVYNELKPYVDSRYVLLDPLARGRRRDERWRVLV